MKVVFSKINIGKTFVTIYSYIHKCFHPYSSKISIKGVKVFMSVSVVLVCVSEAGPLLSKNFYSKSLFLSHHWSCIQYWKKRLLKDDCNFLCKNSVQMFWSTCSTITHYNNISCKIRSNRCALWITAFWNKQILLIELKLKLENSGTLFDD